nr:M28 family metallopeptidase [Actinomycetota bacterium]
WVVGAHYDTKDIPGFVGANDGAAGTAAVIELARDLRGMRRPGGHELRFVLFDGEESPRGSPPGEFLRDGLRGSKAYAARHRGELAGMVLIDFVADRDLLLPREAFSNAALWARLRRAAARAGVASTFPPSTAQGVYDDHTPFSATGVPAIDLIDFRYPCFHRTCDDLRHVSAGSLDRAGEAVLELARGL